MGPHDNHLIRCELRSSSASAPVGANLAQGRGGRNLSMAWSVRTRRVLTMAAMFAMVMALSARALAQDGYRIVVNPANPVASLSRNQVSKLFLDKGTWDDGVAVAPVDLLPSSPVRDGFSREVLGVPVPAAVARM